MTFYCWLMKIKKEATYLGDLARAVSLDNCHPRKNTFEEWKLYLGAMSADVDVIENFHEAWRLYEAAKSPPKSEQQYKRNLKDDKWSIRRPALPSFWNQIPEIMHVMCDTKTDVYSWRETVRQEARFFSLENNLVVCFVCSKKFCYAVKQLGEYSKKELEYDFLPYTVGEHAREGDGRIQPYLFFNSQESYDRIARPIGACVFMLQGDYEHWVMNWVWMHPYARRKGHLTKAWPYFRRRYADFRIKTPLSESMKSFLKKNEYRFFVS